MEYNRSSTDIFKEDAFTNNTFSLKDTEGTLRKTLENSFNYLKKLQKSYINIKKFVKSEDDFYIDDDGNLCLYMSFIDNTNACIDYRSTDDDKEHSIHWTICRSTLL